MARLKIFRRVNTYKLRRSNNCWISVLLFDLGFCLNRASRQNNGNSKMKTCPDNPLKKIKTHENPKTNVSAGWSKLYQSGVVNSIMKRMPMHEPWLLHENQLPSIVSPTNTDRET
jgi:hypothetical protein